MINNLRTYQGHFPQIDAQAYIDPSAIIIGQVSIGANSSIWCNSVLRGDVSYIKIGNNSNIQDLTMLHVSHENLPFNQEIGLTIGDNVTIGHNCCLHACYLEDNVFVGMGTTILDNAYLEKNVMVGAGSLIPPNKRLETGYLYFGNPIKQIRKLSAQEIEHINYSAQHYVKIANQHRNS
jgi:carbonic anhydrase/acetyltransferase-like protein (isoleucine patch superfamily)